ncbi:tRNA N(3)-methylcytidine methyltransferase METTL6-like [Lucilia sericata]|uniref:tRNA N(3)-methylcytidine methyltransferase METTL6-like n=1 Tax=Lucilia sericata TaxID=13632 RepID=UPI0018A81131|nr:tRNA N(3)-methylcytidine methyltransferase METTL6-like [Lucilia sericata]XP_037825240.1 tRNA N(3)-methylcytidine methyltransferase METTL6-like [Lucilia sericata]
MDNLDNNNQLIEDVFTTSEKSLTDDEKQKLTEQNKRLIPEFKARQLEAQAQKHWDLFYKRNETRFFKDRRWTTREFQELIQEDVDASSLQGCRKLLEVGCGVGNFVYPLMEELEALGQLNNYFYACDFSPRAVEFVRSNPKYDENKIKAFQCDITTQTIHDNIPAESLDIISMIFVLSAITPEKFDTVIKNLYKVLKSGGIVLFRDYGRYDMAQLRFKSGHKIAENFYMRQDGTRSYYFAEQELANLFRDNGFEILSNCYVHRRTLNVKEGIDVPRIFLQGKFRKL